MVKKKNLSHAVHLLLAFYLIIKGLEKFSHHKIIGSLILSFGVIILIYFLYVTLIKEGSRKLHILVHSFEALTSLFTAYIFFTEGKKYLPYVSLLAAFGFLIVVFRE